MNTLDGLPISDHYQRLLAKAKEKDAWAILHEFFDFFNEESPKEHLWYMLVLSLKNDNDEIEARHRSNMIFFYEYSCILFKAVQFLNANQNPKRKKKRHK